MHKRGYMPDLPGLMLELLLHRCGQFGSKSLDYRRRFLIILITWPSFLYIQPAWELRLFSSSGINSGSGVNESWRDLWWFLHCSHDSQRRFCFKSWSCFTAWAWVRFGSCSVLRWVWFPAKWVDRYDQGCWSQACSFYTFTRFYDSLLDKLGFEAYLAPVNTVGYGWNQMWKHAKGSWTNKEAVIAIKPLAAGKLSPESLFRIYLQVCRFNSGWNYNGRGDGGNILRSSCMRIIQMLLTVLIIKNLLQGM